MGPLFRPPCFAALLLAVWFSPVARGQDAPRTEQTDSFVEQQVRPLVQTYCSECHGLEVQEAELRLDNLAPDFDDPPTARIWAQVRDKLNGGSMPPPEARQPDPAKVIAITHWIAGQQASAAVRAQATGGRVVLRRLNRAEYNNTIRDLVGIDFQPAADFPADPPASGFENVGAALSLSPLLLEKYLAAAREIVGLAIDAGPRGPTWKWSMEVERGHHTNQFPGRESAGDDELWVPDVVFRDHRYLIKGSGTEVREGFLVKKGSRDEYGAGFRWFRVPVSGQYLIRIRAAGVIPTRDEVVRSAQRVLLKNLAEGDWKDLNETQREHRKEDWLRDEWPQIEEHFRTDPIYDYGPPRMKVATDDQLILGEASVEATPAAPQVFEYRVDFQVSANETVGIDVTNNYHVPRTLENWIRDDPDFARPELWIDWVEVEGVYYDAWPPASQRKILGAADKSGETPADETAQAQAVLQRFAARAFRRPVTAEQVRPYVELFSSVRPSKRSFEDAIQTPLAAVLVSPHYLFLVEPSESSLARPLNDYEIASRLSYFLWSTMPDEELFALAGRQALRDPGVLRAQVDRMLADPRAGEFFKNFTRGWLGLRELGANRPVETLFPRYDLHLEESMAGESAAFFTEILRNDRSALDLIRSDYVTINERLARFYEIPGVRGDDFRRVDVSPGDHRGGLLTQAAVLTATSNGTRTSPVVRGVWILQNLLGDPPPSPPPDAGDLAPVVPGIDRATVRERLEAHRRIPQCAACHEKIDPLGFALENYDAHGRWRDQYGFGYEGRVREEDPAVDARAVLPDGQTIDGVADLQAALLAREDDFLGCLVGKLMVYALGRATEPADDPLIERIVFEMKVGGYHLRTAIQEIVVSDAFLTK